MSIESDAYEKHKNLKLAANALGMVWQTLYVHLKKQGVAIVGDKLKYGSDRDRLGAFGESFFKKLVPLATDRNRSEFQSKYDFDVCGYKVDVKCGMPRMLNKRYKSESWSFSFKRQSLIADFIVCFCLTKDKEIEHILLVPSEFFKGLQTVSVSRRGDSKWLNYCVKESELANFFDSLPSMLISD